MKNSPQKRLAENEVLILRALEKNSMTFEGLIKIMGLSRPVLSKHLKDLQRRGLIHRNPEGRKYEVVQPPESGEVSYSIWESTDIGSVRRAARWVDQILDSMLPSKERPHLLMSFLDASFQFMAANVALSLSEAAQKKNPQEALASTRVMIDSYMWPYLQFLTLYAWEHGPKVARCLELVGSSISHEAKKEFNIEEALKGLKPEYGEQNVVRQEGGRDR